MISFFKVNDPFRIIVLFFLLLAIRLPLIIWGIPLSTPEFSWILLGEKINEGLLIYRDIDDNTGPIMAYFLQFSYKLFGRSVIAMQILSLCLVFIQAISLNLNFNKSEVLKEKTFLPGLFYILLSSMSFEFFTLSPALIATTFLLFSINNLFEILKSGSRDERVFLSGFYIGIASLFYMPCVIFSILTLITFLLYSNVSVRRYGVFIFGVLFPIIMFGLYYYWMDGLKIFVSDILVYSFLVDSIRYVNFSQILIFLSPLILLLIFAVVKTFGARGFINYQNILQVFFLFYIVFGIASIFLAFKISYANLFIFLPSLTFFFTNLFVEIKKKLINILTFSFTLILLITMGYSIVSSSPSIQQMFYSKNLIVANNTTPHYGRILVLDNEVKYYLNNEKATRFFNWELSKKYFENVKDYKNVLTIYNTLKNDLPDAIIDPEQKYAAQFLQHIPEISNLYSNKGNGIFLKNK